MVRVISPQRRSMVASCIAAGRPLVKGLHAGAGREHLLVVLQDLGALVRGAGPPQLTVAVDQHDPGGVGVEQLLGRLDGLLEGGGQVLVGVQGQGAGRSGCRCFWPAWRGRSAWACAFGSGSPNWRTRS